MAEMRNRYGEMTRPLLAKELQIPDHPPGGPENPMLILLRQSTD
jgi:hypothetical protein